MLNIKFKKKIDARYEDKLYVCKKCERAFL